MIKNFCDRCGLEIIPALSIEKLAVSDTLSDKTSKVIVGVATEYTSERADVIICRNCVVDLVNTLDTRKK